MYQALYRKYRAKNFDEIVGQKVIVKTLMNEIKNDCLNHAYLFTGPRGTGKTSVAKLLGKTINCLNKINDVHCNECISCTQSNNNTNIDIIEIDAASNNGVDEIREIKSKVGLVPSLGKYKIYIIDEVHMLTIGAFNALLKTLEEPPAHVIFILATTDPHKIPTTILSSCQRFDFKKIDSDSIVKRLNDVVSEEKINISEESLLEIARLSDGGMRDALSLLDQIIAYKNNDITVEDVHLINGTVSLNEIFEMIKNIKNENLVENLNLIEKYNSMGINFYKLIEEILHYLRNILLFKIAPKYLEVNKELINEYKNISQEIKKNNIMEMVKIFNEALNDMKYSNNSKLIFELALIQMVSESSESIGKCIKTKPKEEKKLSDKSNNLEKKEKKLENNKIVSNQNNFDKTIMEEIKKNRIENCLSRFIKKDHLHNFNTFNDLTFLLHSGENSKKISLLVDADLKASSEEYLIYVCKDKNNSDIFNLSLNDLEKIIKKEFDKDMKLISCSMDEWEIIKKEFNSKIKIFKYNEEKNIHKEFIYNIKKIEKEENDIEDLFDGIVEYEEN